MYTKMIEEDFAMNRQQYSKTIKNHKSVFTQVNEDFVAVEKNITNVDKNPISFINDPNLNNNSSAMNLGSDALIDIERSVRKPNSRLHYTMIGMCFVNEKCIDYTH